MCLLFLAPCHWWRVVDAYVVQWARKHAVGKNQLVERRAWSGDSGEGRGGTLDVSLTITEVNLYLVSESRR